MSWQQISRFPLGLSQTLRRISYLITHACLMSGTLTLLSVFCLQEKSQRKELLKETGFDLQTGMLCDNVASFVGRGR